MTLPMALAPRQCLISQAIGTIMPLLDILFVPRKARSRRPKVHDGVGRYYDLRQLTKARMRLLGRGQARPTATMIMPPINIMIPPIVNSQDALERLPSSERKPPARGGT